MKKVVVAAVIVGSFILYSLLYHQADSVAAVPSSPSVSSIPSSRNSSPTATPTIGSGTGSPPTNSPSSSHYKDGSYTGSVADAHWGNIQVQVSIQNGKITNVQFLQYPNERERSILINNDADPQLSSEAIQAQSANVDVITGATDTSEAFMQSLSDALSQAQA